MFDPWTATAQEAAETGDMDMVLRWGAAQDVLAARKKIEEGDGCAVLECLANCLRTGLAPPEWLVRAYLARYRLVAHHKVGSWDDAFGKPVAKGAHLSKLRQKRELMWAIWLRVKDAHPKDEGLFTEVGAEFGIGKTVCAEYYYEAVRRMTSAKK